MADPHRKASSVCMVGLGTTLGRPQYLPMRSMPAGADSDLKLAVLTLGGLFTRAKAAFSKRESVRRRFYTPSTPSRFESFELRTTLPRTGCNRRECIL